jgi:hypothetical protein
VFNYALRPGAAALEIGGAGVVAALVWFLSSIDVVLLGAIVLLGIDVAVTSNGHSLASRDVVALVAGSFLYLMHSSAALSVLMKGEVAVDASVIRNWTKRTAPIACSSVAGAAAAVAGRAAGSGRFVLVVGAIVVGLASLILLWISRLSHSDSPRNVQLPHARGAR